MRLDSPEHSAAQDAKAFAYVRPHDLEVQRYAPGAEGIVVHLERAIVIRPIARLELVPAEGYEQKGNASGDSIIEAQMPSQQFSDMALREGDMLVVTPRKAKVFVES